MRYLPFLIVFLYTHTAKAQHKYFGRNLISIAAIANNTGPGLGLQYEYFLKGDKLSFIAPVYCCFSYVERHTSSRQNLPETGKDQRPTMVFVEPGFRFYPTRSSGVARYALGCHIFIGEGKGASHYYINGTNELQHRSLFGIAISNSINFHITRYVRLGFDLSLGVCGDDGVNATADTGGTNPFGQFAINLGGRF